MFYALFSNGNFRAPARSGGRSGLHLFLFGNLQFPGGPCVAVKVFFEALRLCPNGYYEYSAFLLLFYTLVPKGIFRVFV